MRAALALVSLLALAGAANAQSFTIANPDARLWRAGETGFGSNARAFTCFNQVCPRGTMITFDEVRGPSPRPAGAALQRLVSEELPRQLAAETADRRAPRLTSSTIQGAPAARGEFRTQGEGSPGAAVAFLFLDGTIVRIRAVSSDAAFTRRAIDAFLPGLRLQGAR